MNDYKLLFDRFYEHLYTRMKETESEQERFYIEQLACFLEIEMIKLGILPQEQ